MVCTAANHIDGKIDEIQSDGEAMQESLEVSRRELKVSLPIDICFH